MAPVQEAAQEKRTVISFEKISIRYRVPREPVSGIKEYAIRLLQGKLQYEDFWALSDVSFDVFRGEIFGVIGRNGAGKSTLLKVMARVLQPHSGRVVIHGRVFPLLELGAGFHPELTGRENVYLNSALLGIARELVEELFDSIVAFAEIGDFIDSPLRTYSTGMVARLGFAVATCIRPEILLVDEVLSVGDAQFQKKCLDRMYDFRAKGTTILMVSHSMATIENFCDRAMWLDHGTVQAIGKASQVIREYITYARSMDLETEQEAEPPPESEVLITPKLGDFTLLNEIGEIYTCEGIFSPEQGAISFWLKLTPGSTISDTVILHTDDSRYVIFVSSYYSEESDQNVSVIVTRAGGNRRVLDPYLGVSTFPEISTTLVADEEWHLFSATWKGYPEGELQIYLDGAYAGERSYSRQHDDNRPVCRSIAVGMRPAEWTGEIIQNEDGSQLESRPESSMNIKDSGVNVADLRLYRTHFNRNDVLGLAELGMHNVP
jgi:ABC-type polysaccharide/polyol phosphate transport system ATPase subunit